MMFLSEIYKANKYKETSKTVSLQKLVSDMRQEKQQKKESLEGAEIRFSQNGAVCIKKWDIKKLKENKK